jgi:hypothetical protein
MVSLADRWTLRGHREEFRHVPVAFPESRYGRNEEKTLRQSEEVKRVLGVHRPDPSKPSSPSYRVHRRASLGDDSRPWI